MEPELKALYQLWTLCFYEIGYLLDNEDFVMVRNNLYQMARISFEIRTLEKGTITERLEKDED